MRAIGADDDPRALPVDDLDIGSSMRRPRSRDGSSRQARNLGKYRDKIDVRRYGRPLGARRRRITRRTAVHGEAGQSRFVGPTFGGVVTPMKPMDPCMLPNLQP